MSDRDLLARNFDRPGPEYRGKPFWSWNGDLDEGELVRQLDVFKKMGLGGAFMHSRTGLVTEYLGDEWFHLTNACADAAQTLGLEGWLYDEDRWPSGTAGGLVTREPAFRSTFILMTQQTPDDYAPDSSALAAFACKLGGLDFADLRPLGGDDRPRDGETALVFTVRESAKSSFYNGFTYVNTMSRAATGQFIELTHEQYKAHCGDRFGKGIKGIFTDEPHRGAAMTGFGIGNPERLNMTPYTDDLFEQFEQRFGYDLRPRLPELFLRPRGAAVSPVKWHYMELTQQLFLERFMRPLYDWCDDNNLVLTGHVLHEDSLTAQAALQGSMMRSYEHMHYPGMDLLTEGNRCYWVAKQLDSACRQLGRKWRLSELYGCTGWQFDFEAHKSVGDWQALFGVNLRCHHLSWYTMRGESKRDYPASISYQSAWWPEYEAVETYFARFGVLMTAGRPCCDVLVINPVESVWCQIRAGWADALSPQDEAVKELERRYAELFHLLAGRQIDFDYGDEEMLSRLCDVDGDALAFGEMRYRAAVVGHMTTIRATTLDRLEKFADVGGRVVFVGEPPRYVDAVESDRPVKLAARATTVRWDADALADALRPSIRRGVSAVDAKTGEPLPEVFCQLREDGDALTLVAINVDRDAGRSVRFRVDAAKDSQVAAWNLLTGDRESVPAATDGDAITFAADLPAAGSFACRVGPGVADGLPPRVDLQVVETLELAGPFAFTLGEPNVLVLDAARFRIDGGDERPAMEILKVDQAVRDALGLPHRAGDMVQPWYRRRFEPDPTPLATLRLAFDFDVETLPADPVELAMERPALFTVALNGHPVDTAAVAGTWVDNAFERLPLPPQAFKVGRNTITLEVGFHGLIDLEAIYLLGTFGVRVDGSNATMTTLPATLSPTDLTAQGLAFYGGPVTYQIPLPPADGERRFLVIPEFEAACLRAGETLIPWRPYEAEVGDAAALDLTAVLTRRNSFGPLHQRPLRAAAYGPDNFTTRGDGFSDAYQLYPAGLLAAPRLERRVPR